MDRQTAAVSCPGSVWTAAFRILLHERYISLIRATIRLRFLLHVAKRSSNESTSFATVTLDWTCAFSGVYSLVHSGSGKGRVTTTIPGDHVLSPDQELRPLLLLRAYENRLLPHPQS